MIVSEVENSDGIVIFPRATGLSCLPLSKFYCFHETSDRNRVISTMSKESESPTIELNPHQLEIAVLKEKLIKAESEKENAMRTAAEYENARKRAVRDAELEKKFASAKLVLDLLLAFDNLDATLGGRAPRTPVPECQ